MLSRFLGQDSDSVRALVHYKRCAVCNLRHFHDNAESSIEVVESSTPELGAYYVYPTFDSQGTFLLTLTLTQTQTQTQTLNGLLCAMGAV